MALFYIAAFHSGRNSVKIILCNKQHCTFVSYKIMICTKYIIQLRQIGYKSIYANYYSKTDLGSNNFKEDLILIITFKGIDSYK